MFKKILLGLTIIVLIFIGFIAFQLSNNSTQSPPSNISIQSEELAISIDYHRPFKKGRNIFGGLVPYGKYWRTGANNATEIEFNKDVHFGDQKVSAGRYRLYTIPNENTWKIVLNSELGKWGLFEPDNSLDILTIEVSSLVSTEIQEQFQIALEASDKRAILSMVWDQTKVEVPILWD
ncbi:MAG: hypothetical protein ACI9P5_004099 [Saprospiraceae bacterium]|jgi:hypothetical protein